MLHQCRTLVTQETSYCYSFHNMSKGTFLCDTGTECNKGWQEININNYYNAYSFVSPFFVVVVVREQIENIDACLSFLAAKGINIQGLSAEGESIPGLKFHFK